MLQASLIEQLAIERTGSNVFVTKVPPEGLGNTASIGYGGITSGVIVLAAHQTVDDGYLPFSVSGSFHGPARTDRRLYCRVHATRDTRTFATRRVTAYQILDDQSERTCAEVMVDFHIREQGLFDYDTPPSSSYYGDPEDRDRTVATPDLADRLCETGAVSQATLNIWKKNFEMSARFTESRQCLAGVSGQNLNVLGKTVETTQDHLPFHEKSSAEWFRFLHPLRRRAEQSAALSFIMDGALSFLPLSFDHKDLYDAGACSTLDFSLRILVPSIDMNSWHLRERKTIAAHGGRTVSEARLWNQQGRMIAIATQTNICRPPRRQGQDRNTKL